MSKIPHTPKLDLLVIDGPAYPAGTKGRYAALPLLKERLSDHVTIIVDDAAVEATRICVARWRREFPGFRAEWHDTVKGTAVLRR